MPIPEDDILLDDDCPPLESGLYAHPVRRFNGRIITPGEPVAADIWHYIQSRVPEVGMQNGVPVFVNTSVPIKRMFDCLLTGNQLGDFLRAFPSVSEACANAVLGNEATLFYEAISKATDSAAMPSSRPR